MEGGCSALLFGPNTGKGCLLAEGTSGSCSAAGGLGVAALEEEERREGVGGCRDPGSGPRPRRASSAVLPRSSPLLIFGLGCPCPGISRHASRRPVRRPEPGRKGGRLGQRRRRRLPGTSMSPRRTLPRPLLLCLCLSLCLAAAAARGAVQSGELGLAPPPLVCPVARTPPS